MVNSPLIRPYFLGGGGIGGVPLDSHESICIYIYYIYICIFTYLHEYHKNQLNVPRTQMGPLVLIGV